MSIAADQQRLVQWAEEKVALATTCADLLEWHSQKLTREIKAFDFELKVRLHQGCVCNTLDDSACSISEELRLASTLHASGLRQGCFKG